MPGKGWPASDLCLSESAVLCFCFSGGVFSRVSCDVGSLVLKCRTRFIVSQYPLQKLLLSFQYKARRKAFGIKKQLCHGIEFVRESNVPGNKQCGRE